MFRKFIIKIKNNFNSYTLKSKQSFLLYFILNTLNIDVSTEVEHNLNFALGIFLLSIVCLLNFISVVGYLTSIYLLSKYNVETKFPKFKKIIKYFENSSLFWVVIEGFTCLIFLICIVVFSLIELGSPIFK